MKTELENLISDAFFSLQRLTKSYFQMTNDDLVVFFGKTMIDVCKLDRKEEGEYQIRSYLSRKSIPKTYFDDLAACWEEAINNYVFAYPEHSEKVSSYKQTILPIFAELAKAYSITEKLGKRCIVNDDALKEELLNYPQIILALNDNFDALRTLEYNDLYLLMSLVWGDQDYIEIIDNKLSEEETWSPFDIADFCSNSSIDKWKKLLKSPKSKQVSIEDLEKKWKIFCGKVDKTDDATALIIAWFLYVVLKKKDKINLALEHGVIKRLIAFKFFLSDNKKRVLLENLQAHSSQLLANRRFSF